MSGNRHRPRTCHRCGEQATFSAYVGSLGVMYACARHAKQGKAWPGWNAL